MGGGRARDGSPSVPSAHPRRRARLIWHGAFDRWWTERRRDNEIEEVFVVEKVKGGYRASKLGKELGVFATVGEAGLACEKAR